MKRMYFFVTMLVLLVTSCSKDEELATGVVEVTVTYKQNDQSEALPDPSALLFLVPSAGKPIDFEESKFNAGQIWFKDEKSIVNFTKPGFVNEKGISIIENVPNGKYVLIVRSIKMSSNTYKEIVVSDNNIALTKTFKTFGSEHEGW